MAAIPNEIPHYAGTTLSYTIDPLTQQITLTADTGLQFLVIYGGYDENRIGYYLGGTDVDTGLITVNSPSYTFPSPPRLYGTTCVTVHCPQIGISTVDFDRGGYLNFPIVRVPTTVPYGEVTHYQAGTHTSNLIVYPSPRHISHLSIRLLNDRGEEVDLRNHDWSFTFKIYYSL